MQLSPNSMKRTGGGSFKTSSMPSATSSSSFSTLRASVPYATLTGMRKRTRSSLYFQLTTFSDQSREEIADDVLQTEAQPDDKRARQHVESGEIDAGALDDDQKADQQEKVARNCADSVPRAGIEIRAGENPVREQGLDALRDPEQRQDQREHVGDQSQRDLDAAELEERRLQHPACLRDPVVQFFQDNHLRTLRRRAGRPTMPVAGVS